MLNAEMVGKAGAIKRPTQLVYLDAAYGLEDLRSPPGNHLEALGGDRKGQRSIRVIDQFRICFIWADGHAEAVEIVDYHW